MILFWSTAFFPHALFLTHNILFYQFGLLTPAHDGVEIIVKLGRVDFRKGRSFVLEG